MLERTIGADELSAVSAQLEEAFKHINPFYNHIITDFEVALNQVLSGRL